MSDENDRSRQIEVDRLGKVFTAPDWFDGVDIDDDDDLFGRAPWFDRDALDLENLIGDYQDEVGWLPGRIPIAATETWCWRFQFACCDKDLVVGHGRTLLGVRREFARHAMNGFNGVMTWIAPPIEANSGMFLFRTCTEREYLTNISAIPAETLETWRGTTGVNRAAYCWPKPLLVAEFRYLRKQSRYWSV